MNSKLQPVGLLISTVILAVGVAWTTGCNEQPGHEKAIRQRHAQLIQALYQEDYDTCVKLTDPAVVQAKGTDGVKLVYKLLGGIAKLAKLTPEDVRIDRIMFNQEFTQADMQTSHRLKGEWKAQKPAHWVRVKGQWYLTP